MNTQYKQKGFTIIEVVLVLAIAGLIFLMVFIALPALQASQRDTARKNDASILSSWYTSYLSNNQGKLPTAATIYNKVGGANVDTYALDVSSNTTAVKVIVPTSSTVPTTTTEGEIDIVEGYVCNTVAPSGKVTLTAETGSGSKAAVITQLEGSSKTGYCLNAS